MWRVFFFFFWGLWERPWEGDGGLLGRIKGGQGLAFTGLPTCSSSPGALVQLGGSDAGLPALGMEGVQGKTCKIIWDKTRWLVLTNELMNMKWKNCYRKRLLKCHFRNITPVGKRDHEWGGTTTVVLIAVPQFLEGLVCLSPERVRPGRQFLMVTLHPRRLMRQRTANLLFTWYVWICTNRVVMPKAPFLMRVKFESSCSLR